MSPSVDLQFSSDASSEIFLAVTTSAAVSQAECGIADDGQVEARYITVVWRYSGDDGETWRKIGDRNTAGGAPFRDQDINANKVLVNPFTFDFGSVHQFEVQAYYCVLEEGVSDYTCYTDAYSSLVFYVTINPRPPPVAILLAPQQAKSTTAFPQRRLPLTRQRCRVPEATRHTSRAKTPASSSSLSSPKLTWRARKTTRCRLEKARMGLLTHPMYREPTRGKNCFLHNFG